MILRSWNKCKQLKSSCCCCFSLGNHPTLYRALTDFVTYTIDRLPTELAHYLKLARYPLLILYFVSMHFLVLIQFWLRRNWKEEEYNHVQCHFINVIFIASQNQLYFTTFIIKQIGIIIATGQIIAFHAFRSVIGTKFRVSTLLKCSGVFAVGSNGHQTPPRHDENVCDISATIFLCTIVYPPNLNWS